jgi:serine/threonine protein kinase
MATYEMTFLAIASKNNFMTHEEAAQCLAELQQQPGRTIEQVVADRGLLTAQQAQTIAAAAQKVAAQRQAAAPPPAEKPPTRVLAAAAPPSERPTARAVVNPTPSPARPATQRVPAAPARPGGPAEPIPGIRIAGKLGVGGTATVFNADDVKNGRKVALKIIHPSLAKDEKAVRRFQREAQLLCGFDHPNLVKGHAAGMMGPLAYFVMEFLEGESAQEVLDREKKLSEARALEIIMETAKAIDYMQGKGFVHRDIKPGNIFLLKDGRVKVLDLGFAQPMSGEGSGDEETTSGTVQYMSPEQARGQRDLDARADIYSLGATLYHMVMGELPFSGSDSLEVMAKQVMEALNASEIKNRRISKHMHYFIERMMSKDKDLRYTTPRELVEDINEQIEGFKSLEYRPEEDETSESSTVMRLVNRPGAPQEPPRTPTRRFQPPTTRKISKIDGITKRFRKR